MFNLNIKKMKQLKLTTKVITHVVILFSLFVSCKQEVKVTPEEAKQIAKEAYIYGFPMVVNYKTMYLYALNEKSSEFKGSFNFIRCDARLFAPEDKAVVTPNSDTPYCMFWVDLRNEPMVISVPKMETERFYHFQLIDLYTHNFGYIGTLTTGNEAGNYLIAGSGWSGVTPDGIDEVMYCETSLFFVVARTQLMDVNDLEKVKRIQSEYNLQSLHEFFGKEKPVTTSVDNFPVWNEGDQFTVASFNYIDMMLGLVNPPEEEKELMKRFAKIGLGTDDKFDINKFSPEVQEAIAKGVKEGFTELEAFIKKATADPLASAKIFGTREFLKESAKKNYDMNDFYMLRTAAAHTGLYGNSGAEAIYPTYFVDNEGQKLDASGNSYKIVFEEGQLPPVSAFWSLTMYDGKTQLLVENPLNRYLLNSTMMDQFVIEEDGSLSLYIQKDSPGKALETNWLPAPKGPFYLVLRLYGPEEAALMGEWVNPPLVKVQ